ncbi:DUF5710 domain-containing protein [Pseudonocardia sp. GCM10023141]|uniref:DUF5710 domain-containing protein n=1 Tax=Pseudonocardia sp. GCM10023141 TaxID=3252653 RepID=UPI00360C648F
MPYADKDAAKSFGARWDPQVKRWYDPRPPTAGLQRWAALAEVSDLLPGEDRSFGSGLFVDMVPSSCWFTNVRTCVSQQDWERLRRMITSRANQRCEICGATEDRSMKRWLEAHERWAYDEHAGVQALRRLICLCSSCHLVTHFGYANVSGRTDEAFTHLRAVTGMTAVDAERHVDAAGQVWIARSARVWSLDLSMLTDAGVTLARPEAAGQRPAAAQRALGEARGATQVSAPESVAGAQAQRTPEPTVTRDVETGQGQPRGSWWQRLTSGR